MLIFLLAYADGRQTQRWPWLVGLSMVYLAVLTLVAKLVVPVQVLQAVVKRAAAVVKLALICNYFSLLLLLLIVLNTWWSRSVILAILFLVSWMGLWIFRVMLAPSFGSKLMPKFYDPASPQGRRGRYD